MDCVPAAFYDHCLRFLQNAQDLREILKPSGLVNPNEDPPVYGRLLIVLDDNDDVVQYKLAFYFSNGLPAVGTFPEALAISRNLKSFSIYSTRAGHTGAAPWLEWLDLDWNEIRRILKLARHFVDVNYSPCRCGYPPIFYDMMRELRVLCTSANVYSPKEYDVIIRQLEFGALKTVNIDDKGFLDVDHHIEAIFGRFFESPIFNNIKLSAECKDFFLDNFHRLLTMWANSNLAPKSVKKTITLYLIQLPEDFGNELPQSHITTDGGDCVLSRHLSGNEDKRVSWNYRHCTLMPATLVTFMTL